MTTPRGRLVNADSERLTDLLSHRNPCAKHPPKMSIVFPKKTSRRNRHRYESPEMRVGSLMEIPGRSSESWTCESRPLILDLEEIPGRDSQIGYNLG